MLMKLALNRPDPNKESKGHRKASGSKAPSEVKLRSLALGEELAKKELEEVEIESFDGTKLVGHWYPCDNEERVIVAMHGWRSRWYKDFGALSEYWHTHGCSIIFAEQRGQNKSGGDFMSFGILERRDCLEWAKWAENKTNAQKPVYLMEKVPGDTVETPIWDTYKELIKPYTNEEPEMIERFAFYERAKEAYAVVMTGESALYANIILKKGVVTD
jgi:hypothetical protein